MFVSANFIKGGNLMNAELKKIFHEAWYEACLMSVRIKSSPTDLLETFQTVLRDKTNAIQLENKLTKEEFARSNLFLAGINTCKESRLATALVAYLYLRDLVHTGILIQMWLSETKKIPSHLKFILRQKSLESDLTKILSKVLSNEFPEVKDRFGFTVISYQNDNLETLYNYAEYFVGIVTGIFYEDQKRFLVWVLNNPKISELEKKQVHRVMDSNISLKNRGELHGSGKEFNTEQFPNVVLPPDDLKFFFHYGFKDYIKNPKKNSYQALQGVFEISASAWDILEEIISEEVYDSSNSKDTFAAIFQENVRTVFPELSQQSLSDIIKIIPSIRVTFPIEVHFKTNAMWNNPLASHDLHKGKVAWIRKLFTLTEEEITLIQKEAASNGTSFKFYDHPLYDPWGLHYPKEFAPEERIFYAEYNSFF